MKKKFKRKLKKKNNIFFKKYFSRKYVILKILNVETQKFIVILLFSLKQKKKT